jgi:hypothetical protein
LGYILGNFLQFHPVTLIAIELIELSRTRLDFFHAACKKEVKQDLEKREVQF